MVTCPHYAGVVQELISEHKKLSAEERSKTYAHRKQKDKESVEDYARDMKLLMVSSQITIPEALNPLDPKQLHNIVPHFPRISCEFS